MRKVFILLAALSAITLSACTKSVSAPVPDANEILFMADYGVDYDVETKATAVTSLSSFKASAVTGTAGSETAVWTNVSYSNAGDSKYVGGKYWPSTNANPYSFYASNIDLTFNAAGNTVTANNGTDVVCAYLASPTYKDVNTLTFNHIFARIGNMTVQAASGYTLSGVSIKVTPKTGGTYNLRTGNGQTNGTGWSSTANGSATELTSGAEGTMANDIYLVPGTYTLTATWTATRGEYTQTFTGKNSDVSLVGGKVNNITATLGGLAEEIKFSVSVTAWGNNGIATTFPVN